MNTKFNNSKERLAELLKTMNVPIKRVDDINWLARNIHINNKNHPNLAEAAFIIEGLLLEEIRTQIKK